MDVYIGYLVVSCLYMLICCYYQARIYVDLMGTFTVLVIQPNCKTDLTIACD